MDNEGVAGAVGIMTWWPTCLVRFNLIKFAQREISKTCSLLAVS